MNSKMIENWNSVVSHDDTVYHLGDFSMNALLGESQGIFDRLNGIKHLIVGNHDQVGVNLQGWASINHILETHVDKQRITLCHYAMRVWNKSHHGAYHLYGHSHGSLPDDITSRSFDVGVDCHNFTPVSMEQVHRIMSKKKWQAIDHHGENTR